MTDTYSYDFVSYEVLHFMKIIVKLYINCQKQCSAILLRYFQGMNDRNISE